MTLGGATPDDRARRWPSRPTPKLLEVPVGSPVLLCERATRDVAGNPVLLSEHVFPAHRTEFVVDLPSPTGLSLVE